MKCSLCQGELGEAVLTISQPDRFELATGVPVEGYRREWRTCQTCDAAIDCPPAISREKLSALSTSYYDIDFGGVSLTERYAKIMALPPHHSDNKNRVRRIRSWLADIRPPREELRVLDIGAGLGVFLSDFLTPPWSGVAVEPDPAAAAHLRELNLFQVEQGLFGADSHLGRFHLITLNKVLEHIEHPHQLLADCRAALAEPLGLIYVEVPASETIGRRPSNDNILGPLHWHLHTPASLSRLMEQAGFHLLNVSRFYEPSGKISIGCLATSQAGREHLACP